MSKTGTQRKKFFATELFSLRKPTGQSFFEFTFGTVMTVFLMMGMIQVFIWAGYDQVKQLDRHNQLLIHDCGRDGLCPLEQLSPKFFQEDGFGDFIRGDYFFGEQNIKFEEHTH